MQKRIPFLLLPARYLLFITIWISIISILNAQTIFYRTFGGPLNDGGECVLQTSDLGYTVVSYTDYYVVNQSFSSQEFGKIAMMRFDKYGDSLWTKTYSFRDYQYAGNLLQTEDGGYIISGYVYMDSTAPFNILIRTNSLGDTLWTKTYGKVLGGFRSNFLLTKDGSYILSGLFNDSSDDYHPTIIKLDKDGNIKWTKRYIQVPAGINIGITEASDNGFMLAVDGSALLKTDSTGNLLWYRYLIPRDTTVPGGGSRFDLITSTREGGYYLIGNKTVKSKYGSELEYHLMVIKTDSKGDTLWVKKLGRAPSATSGYNTYHPFSFCYLDDGGLIMSGNGVYQAFLLRMDSTGNEVWAKDMEKESFQSSLHSVKSTFDGGFISVGTKRITRSVKSDILLVKSDDEGNTTGIEKREGEITNTGNLILNQNYPNPFNPSTRITYQLNKDSNVELSLYNILGEKITTLVSKYQIAGRYSFDLNIEISDKNLQSGIYIYVLKTGYNCAAKKMIVVR